MKLACMQGSIVTEINCCYAFFINAPVNQNLLLGKRDQFLSQRKGKQS